MRIDRSLTDAELEPAGRIDGGHVHGERLDERAADFGDADLQVDLQRCRHTQAADDIGLLADIGLHQAFRFGGIFRGLDGSGQQESAGTHRRDADPRFRHGEAQHGVHAVEIGTDPHRGRPDHGACGIAGIDRGGAAGLAEDVELAGGLHLHVGHGLVGDEDVGHGTRHVDKLAVADRERHVLRGMDD